MNTTRIGALLLALLMFTSCKNTRYISIEESKDVRRYTKNHNNGKTKNEFNYFIEHRGITYHVDNPVLTVSDEDSISLSGTLTIPNNRFKEVRDTINYFPQKNVRSKEYINQVVIKIPDESKDIEINNTISLSEIIYPVEAYEYMNPTLGYVLAGAGATVITFIIIGVTQILTSGLF